MDIFLSTGYLFLLKLPGTVSVLTVFDGIVFFLLHLITESSITLPTYLSFSQLHATGFQI